MKALFSRNNCFLLIENQFVKSNFVSKLISDIFTSTLLFNVEISDHDIYYIFFSVFASTVLNKRVGFCSNSKPKSECASVLTPRSFKPP